MTTHGRTRAPKESRKAAVVRAQARVPIWTACYALDEREGKKKSDDATPPKPSVDRAALLSALRLEPQARADEEMHVLTEWARGIDIRDERLDRARRSQPGWLSMFCRAMKLSAFAPMQCLFEQGEMGENIYIVISGTVGIYRKSATDQPNGESKRQHAADASSKRRSSTRMVAGGSTRKSAGRLSVVGGQPRVRSSVVGKRASIAPPGGFNGGLARMLYGQQLTTCSTDELFGELALLYAQPRAASAVALDDVLVVTIHRNHFARLLRKVAAQRANINVDLLSSLPEFALFEHRDLVQLQYTLKTAAIGGGHELLRQGESADTLLVVKHGAVSVRVQTEYGQAEVGGRDVGVYARGAVLGVVDRAVRTAPYSVLTADETEVILINRTDMYRSTSVAAIEHFVALQARRWDAWMTRLNASRRLMPPEKVNAAATRAWAAPAAPAPECNEATPGTGTPHAPPDAGIRDGSGEHAKGSEHRAVGWRYDALSGAYMRTVDAILMHGHAPPAESVQPSTPDSADTSHARRAKRRVARKVREPGASERRRDERPLTAVAQTRAEGERRPATAGLAYELERTETARGAEAQLSQDVRSPVSQPSTPASTARTVRALRSPARTPSPTPLRSPRAVTPRLLTLDAPPKGVDERVAAFLAPVGSGAVHAGRTGRAHPQSAARDATGRSAEGAPRFRAVRGGSALPARSIWSAASSPTSSLSTSASSGEATPLWHKQRDNRIIS